jgi:hypothetical protein
VGAEDKFLLTGREMGIAERFFANGRKWNVHFETPLIFMLEFYPIFFIKSRCGLEKNELIKKLFLNGDFILKRGSLLRRNLLTKPWG